MSKSTRYEPPPYQPNDSQYDSYLSTCKYRSHNFLKRSASQAFTSDTNSTWGHGILSPTCLFTPNGGLQNPTTGEAISGGIYGPLAGPVAGASIIGVDYTGRDFGHGFAYPVARQNFALDAAANLSAVQAISGIYGLHSTPEALTAAGCGKTGRSALI